MDRVNLLIACTFTVLFLLPHPSLHAQSNSYPTDRVSLVNYRLGVNVDLAAESMQASCEITVVNNSEVPLDHVPLILYRLLYVDSITDAQGDSVAFSQEVKSFSDWRRMQANFIEIPLAEPLAPGKDMTLNISYSGHLLGYTETGMLYVQDRIDSAFSIIRMDSFGYPQVGYPSWGLNRAAGLTNFDYFATVKVPSGYVVANGGTLVERLDSDSTVTFNYKNSKPAWRMDFAIAEYEIIETEGHRIFCFKEDTDGGGRMMETMRKTLSLYSDWFGPLEGDSRFAVIEIPEGWGSQADVTSIIQTSAAFKNESSAYELYHEISHLWNVRSNESFPPRWNEGLAMFLQHYTEEHLGQGSLEEALQKRWKRLHEIFSKNPNYQAVAPSKYGIENMTGLSYSVGMIMFSQLHKQIGSEKFHKLIGEFYKRYRNSGATTREFTSLANEIAGESLDSFFQYWLYSAAFVADIMRQTRIEELSTKR